MSSSLYMRSLHLENFRGFQNLLLDFHPRLNVFLGNNGAGKSSILDALSIALGEILLRTIFPAVMENLMHMQELLSTFWNDGFKDCASQCKNI